MISRRTYLPTLHDPDIHSFECVIADNNLPKSKKISSRYHKQISIYDIPKNISYNILTDALSYVLSPTPTAITGRP